jgi:tRNA-intron endonuclease, archaea type
MAKKKEAKKKIRKSKERQEQLALEKEIKEMQDEPIIAPAEPEKKPGHALPEDEKILAPAEPEKKEERKEKAREEKVKAFFARERIITESTDEARNFYAKSCYGQVIDSGKIQLSLPEALYLLEKGKIDVFDGKKKISQEEFIKKARKAEPNFWIRYCVFKDMRNRGYVIKTALKFGADYRVYDRGVKPGEDHARWIIFPVHEGETLTWYEFAAKNRVAHSTKKRLMMGIVDDEGDVTYYEIKWMRP